VPDPLDFSDFSRRQARPAADSLAFLVDDGQIWLQRRGKVLYLPCIDELRVTVRESFHIGRVGQKDCFRVVANSVPANGTTGEWVGLRQAFLWLDQPLFLMAGRAVQLFHWCDEHRFCSRCGSTCERHPHEHAMVCKHCGFRQYPRINPCIIVLVTRGPEALLAQGARFPEGMHSCLAGFIEAGENAEQALRREVREEVGLEVEALRYHGSQSWPFPHSLMLGYRAEWRAGEISPDRQEIVSAGWFSKQSLPRLPPPQSIARELIEAWLQEQQA